MAASMTQERETKFELTPHDYSVLLAAGRLSNEVRQRNVYFDRGWRLATLAATCRIRQSDDGSSVLTLKLPVYRTGRARVMTEYELPLSSEACFARLRPEIDVEREMPLEMASALMMLGVSRLLRVGEVRNKRTVLEVPGVGEIELDELTLPNGQVVYEVEIEGHDLQVEEALVSWVLQRARSATPSAVSKFQRFRTALCESYEPREKEQPPHAGAIETGHCWV